MADDQDDQDRLDAVSFEELDRIRHRLGIEHIAASDRQTGLLSEEDLRNAIHEHQRHEARLRQEELNRGHTVQVAVFGRNRIG